MEARKNLLFCLIVQVSPLIAVDLMGHLEPLFSHGTKLQVEVYDGFPTAREFYNKFVNIPKPVLFRGGSLQHPAYALWSNEYFLSFPQSEEHLVTVELEKKENRTATGEDVLFADFVRELNSSGKYMVSSVPEFLRQDVLLPPSISCTDITQGNLVQDMLWLSSGGTKSVLHNDHAENIMCVFRGTKEFFLIDKQYQELVNVTERGYSEVDVDSVDMNKYPGLDNIEYHFAFIEPGDCLYVPFLWVHHVRSYGFNVAVNVWWRHGVQVNFSSCDVKSGRTIEHLTFIGFGALHDAQRKLLRNRLTHLVKSNGDHLSFEELQGFFRKPDVFGPDVPWTEEMSNVVKKLFILMDKSPDDNIGRDELEHLQREDWEQVRVLVNELTEQAMAETPAEEQKHVEEQESHMEL